MPCVGVRVLVVVVVVKDGATLQRINHLSIFPRSPYQLAISESLKSIPKKKGTARAYHRRF
jgi:hypothetical protein